MHNQTLHDNDSCHANTQTQALTQEVKTNVDTIRISMSEKKITLLSLRNQDWKKVKFETEKVNVLLKNISTNDIMKLNCNTICRWPAKQTIPLSVLARNETKGFWTWNLGVAGRGNGTREESWLEKGADKQLATGQQRGESAEDRIHRRRSSQDVGIPVALWNFR